MLEGLQEQLAESKLENETLLAQIKVGFERERHVQQPYSYFRGGLIFIKGVSFLNIHTDLIKNVLKI